MTETYQGIERRSYVACPLHEGLDRRIDNMDTKLDKIIEMQSNHRNDITQLKDTVEDGLKSRVIEVAETSRALDAKLDAISDRLIPIEGFSWFREWMTDLRNNLFKRSLTLAAIGGALYAALHFGDKVIEKMIGSALG